MTQSRRSTVFFISILLIGIVFACGQNYYFRSTYSDTNTMLREAKSLLVKPYLKAHMKNGDVNVLTTTWNIDTIQNIITGTGKVFDFSRNLKHEGDLLIPIDSVAIFETNKKLIKPEEGRITALAVLAGIDILVATICIFNPKACWGSCPTFYTDKNSELLASDAEGFSNAISPSLEYRDIDALGPKKISGNSFTLTMKNEALETHCVKDVSLIAIERKHDERIYQSPQDEFFLCGKTYPLKRAKADEGDIKHLLSKADMIERSNLADKNNLNSKEEIYLSFDRSNLSDEAGLVLHFRQSLMTTYLFYSAMGYMGDQVGDVFAILENDKTMRDKFDGTTKLLGGISVFMWDDSKMKWEFQGQVNETGPIAINKQIIPLHDLKKHADVRIKLVLNKGFWRLDQAALTEIKKKVDPISISVNKIHNKGKEDQKALSNLLSPDKYLISMPGDEFDLHYKLPESQNEEWELFISSKGYYLEWMRAEWFKDKDLLKLREMVEDPKGFLKKMAPDFKIYEHTMEEQFWNSRIDTKKFSYYEN